MSREAAIRDFLSREGWAGARRAPLAGDASARRYERLGQRGRGAVLMDMPPGSGLSPAPFLGVTRWLRSAGFSAPEVLAAEPDAGLVLLEDLGDDTFARLCAADAGREAGLYGAAIDCIAAIQRLAPPAGDEGWMPPRYDMGIVLREARLAAEWYLPAATGAAVPAEASDEYVALVEAAVAPLLAVSPVAVLVDFHVENLIWLPERAGVARVGILDHQDLRLGHPAYDVISLLEDARRDTAPALRAAMLARYLAASGAEPVEFDRAAHVLAAQRNLKILGLFTRLCRRDGKPRYLDHLPRVWDHLMRDLEHPALAPLAAWVRTRLPAPGEGVRARIAAGAA
jgi:aminoglycoside/choline kinase family phosphotransferase